MKSICVFVGASYGRKSDYLEAVKNLAIEIVKRNLELVYGGGKLGLMGVLANTVIENGGKVTGVITQALYEQEAHLGISNLHVVESMQERKCLMTNLADGFITCPGGLGTLEEIFEIWNASKINLHKKSLGILNTDSYFNKLIEFIDHSVYEEFLKHEVRQLMKVSNCPCDLLDMLTKQHVSSPAEAVVPADSL